MKLFRQERIDGPCINPLERDHPRFVAYSFLWSVANRGAFIYSNDTEERLPQGYRIGTWVEKKDSKLGHAFGLSRPKPSKKDKDFTISTKLFVVDREKETIVETPKSLTISTESDIHDQIDTTLEVYDRDEMYLALNIMKKMKKVVKNHGQGHLDMHVGHALAIAHLDDLAEMYPSP